MGKYVIVGAGQIGSQLAERLAADGDEVTVVTRSGSGPDAPLVHKVAADATDQAKLTELTRGADSLINCANPPYNTWTKDWPPLAESMLATAEATDVPLVILSNIYGYGPVDRPMTEDMPLAARSVKGQVRAKMWQDALTAHEAGRARVTEVRSSDYYGPGAGELSHFGSRMIPRLLKGKAAQYIGDPDVPHSVTYIPDVVDALATVARDERSFGRPWHVPTAAAPTARQFVTRVAELAGAKPGRISVTPHFALRAAGLFMPVLRELEEVRYQFVEPFVLDSSDFEQTFGVRPTPLDKAIEATIAWWQR